jgi:hypothetical protein
VSFSELSPYEKDREKNVNITANWDENMFLQEKVLQFLGATAV